MNAQASRKKKRIKHTIIVKEYYENGLLKEKGKKKLIMKVSTRPDGRSCGVMSFLKQGKWTEYHINGKKKRTLLYEKGKIVRILKYWNKKGKNIKGNKPQDH